MKLQSRNTTSRWTRLKAVGYSFVVTVLVVLGLWVPFYFDAGTSTLLLDGSSADRKYELGTTATLNCTVTDGGGRACMNISHPQGNVTCDGDASYQRTFAPSYLRYDSDTSGRSKIVFDFSGGYSTVIRNITMNGEDEVVNASLRLNGTTNSGLPHNITITLANSSFIDWAFTGYLNGTDLIQNITHENKSIHNITFTSAGTQIVYIQMAKGINVTYAKADFYGASAQESLYYNDTFDSHDGINWSRTNANISRDTANDWIETNYSTEANTNYTVISTRLYAPTADVVSATLTVDDNNVGYYLDVYANCSAFIAPDKTYLNVTALNTSLYRFWSEQNTSFQANRRNVLLNTFLGSYNQDDGVISGCSSFEKIVTHYASDINKSIFVYRHRFDMKGNPGGTYAHTEHWSLTGATEAEVGHWTQLDEGLHTPGYNARAYMYLRDDDSTFFSRYRDYDDYLDHIWNWSNSILGYDLYTITNASDGFYSDLNWYCTNCDSLNYFTADMRIVVISDATNTTNSSYEGTPTIPYCSSSASCVYNEHTINFTANTSLSTEPGPMREVDYYLSGDNGSTWIAAPNGTEVTLTTAGKVPIWKAEINHSVNNSNETRIYGVNVTVEDNLCSSIWIDTLGDGISIYDGNSTFDYTLEWTFDHEEFNASVAGSSDVRPGVPIYISCFSPGKVVMENITVRAGLDNPISTNDTSVSTFLDGRSGSVEVPLNITADGGNLEVNFSFDYKGSGNVTVLCYNQTGGGANDTQNMQFRYSKFNVSLPTGIDNINFYPASANSRNVTPEGQIIYVNGTCDTPSYNITSLAYDDAFQLYVSHNETIETCINETMDDDCTQPGGVIINASWQEVDSSVAVGASTGIYSWVDLYSCTAGNAYLLPWNFTARCVDCVEVW